MIEALLSIGKITFIMILICVIIYALQQGNYAKFKIWMEHMSRK